MDKELEELVKKNARLAVQVEVLRWAKLHKEALENAGLVDDLLAALERAVQS